MTIQTGYWADHEYKRLSVKEYVEGFCGWEALTELVSHIYDLRDKAFVSALFLTGGRVSEVLALRKHNFEIHREQGLIIVRGMPLLKRYKKIAPAKDGKRKWITERLIKTRKPFPILIKEPLTPFLLSWLDKCEDLLFPSPYKEGEPLTRFWGYKFIRKLDSRLPLSLKQKLGLVRRQGSRENVLHLWLHWFRSQRASQLVDDYNYEVIDLIDYFSWERHDTALTYARRGWRGLASKMQASTLTQTVTV